MMETIRRKLVNWFWLGLYWQLNLFATETFYYSLAVMRCTLKSYDSNEITVNTQVNLPVTERFICQCSPSLSQIRHRNIKIGYGNKLTCLCELDWQQCIELHGYAKKSH